MKKNSLDPIARLSLMVAVFAAGAAAGSAAGDPITWITISTAHTILSIVLRVVGGRRVGTNKVPMIRTYPAEAALRRMRDMEKN